MNTVAELRITDLAAVEQLGEQVWDALTTAGYDPAPKGAGADGFDILRTTTAGPLAVAVIARFEGVLYGMPIAVRRKHLYLYESVLARGGFVVRMVKETRKPGAEPEPVLLVAALTDQAADEGAALARTALEAAA